MSITILPVPAIDDIIWRYAGQSNLQPIALHLEESGEVSVYTSPDIGNSTLMTVWHCRTVAWSVRASQAPALAVMLKDQDDSLVALLERVHAGHAVEWDGSNMVGTMDYDARTAYDAIERLLDDLPTTDIMTAMDYVADTSTLAGLGLLSDDLSDDAVAAAAAELREQARSDIVIVGDLEEAIKRQAQRILDDNEADDDDGDE